MTVTSDRIKLRHLQVFLEIAREQSVGKAAISLNISQPAVSKTLRELEDELGVKLFERAGRSVQLSRFGKVFQRYAGASFTTLKQGIASVAEIKNQGASSLAIGALPTISSGILPTAVLQFRKENPRILLRVINGENRSLLHQLVNGELDLVVGRLQRADQLSGLSFEHIYSEEIGFFTRPNHPLALAKTFSFAELANYPVIYPGSHAVIRPTVDAFLLANGIPGLSNTIETVSVPFARSVARQSDAVWIISKGAVLDDIELGLLNELDIDTSKTAGSVGLTMRADAPKSAALQLFCQSIRDAAKAS